MKTHMHHHQPWRWTAPLLLAAVFAGGAAPGPETATAPTSAVSSDLSTPVAAATTLITALHDGRFSAARDALNIPADQKPAVDAFLDAMAATFRLQQAASARFLSAADALFKPPTPADLAARLKRIADGQLTVNGDTAALILAPDTAASSASQPATQPVAQALEFTKVDTSWKVDAPSFFNLTAEPADTIANRAALARKIASVADSVAADIAAGKFFSAADAYQEYWSRCLQAAAPATTASSTAPAPTPATAPATTTKP
jgi:hypothetical protein